MDTLGQPLLGLPIPSPRPHHTRLTPVLALSAQLGFRASFQLRSYNLHHGNSHMAISSWIASGSGSHICLGWKSVLVPRHIHPPHCVRRRPATARCAFSQASSSNWNSSSVSPSSGSTFGQRVRAFCFYATTYIVALPLFVAMLLVHPLVLLFDKQKRKTQHLINKVWATLTILPFYKTQIEGWENLPGPDEPAVYVSNHQSFLDIYTLFLLNRPFKFISKTSIFLIPIIGWAMYLTGHIPLRRVDTKSQMECMKHCLRLVKQGVPVFFFPEGTRSTDGKMGKFKRGAFTIAAKTNVPVVPISLIGTGKLMPNGREGTLKPGSVKVIIHKPIQGSNPDELCEQSWVTISQSLLKHGLEVH